jgi:hypothetical protein
MSAVGFIFEALVDVVIPVVMAVLSAGQAGRAHERRDWPRVWKHGALMAIFLILLLTGGLS